MNPGFAHESPGLDTSHPWMGEVWKPAKLRKAIVLLGWNAAGEEVTSHGVTRVAGAHGCILRTHEELPFHGRVELCCNHQEIEGYLQPCDSAADHPGADADGSHQYVIGFEHPAPDYWDIPLELCEYKQEKVQVECRTCRFCIAAELDDVEAMIYEAEAAIVRQCPCCRAQSGFTPPCERTGVYDSAQDPNLVVSGHHIYHLRPAKKEINEREYRRVLTSARALIRISGREDEIVDVLDESRGGLRFESPTNYEIGIEMEIAMHYVRGGNNIFQKGKLVRKQRRPTESWAGEYGVMFLDGKKPS
jgi:hypothetical protein